MTQAEDFAERFNALAFQRGKALSVILFLEELDNAADFLPDDGKPSASDYVSGEAGAHSYAPSNPAFTIFADAHMEGTYTFGDGSRMLVSRIAGTSERKASVL